MTLGIRIGARSPPNPDSGLTCMSVTIAEGPSPCQSRLPCTFGVSSARITLARAEPISFPIREERGLEHDDDRAGAGGTRGAENRRAGRQYLGGRGHPDDPPRVG